MPLPNECAPFKLNWCTAWVNVERLCKCPITQVRYHCPPRAKALGDEARANSIYNGRVSSLTKQIANFKRLLEECERKNGKP